MNDKSSNKRAVVLLSGGLDSTTVLAIAKNQGYELFTLTIGYGQRHAIELETARQTAKYWGAKDHLQIALPLDKIGGSSLTSSDQQIPKGREESAIGQGVPSTYVPARNLIFLSIATGWAEVLGAENIFIGVNAVDYSGYPDCRPEFIESFAQTATLGTAAGAEKGKAMRIHAPLSGMSKVEIIQRGLELGVDYSLTHSCYDPDDSGKACGACDSCLLRKAGFEEADIEDPTIYGDVK